MNPDLWQKILPLFTTKTCEECVKLTSTLDSLIKYDWNAAEITQAIKEDVLLHCLHHAFKHNHREEIAAYLPYFFSGATKIVQHLGRAHLLQAKLARGTLYQLQPTLPNVTSTQEFSETIDRINKAIEIGKRKSGLCPELLYNCSVVFWDLFRCLMKKGTWKLLVPGFRSVISAFEASGLEDNEWKAVLYLGLLQGLMESENWFEASDAWNTVNNLLSATSPFRYKLAKLQFEDGFSDRLKISKTQDDVLTNHLQRIMKFKQEHKTLKQTTEEELNNLLSDITQIQKNKTGQITDSQRYSLIVDLFFFCLEINAYSFAKTCLSFADKLNFTTAEKTILHLLWKESTINFSQMDPEQRSKEEVKQLVKCYKAVEKLLAECNCNAIEASASLLWNLCLKYMEPQFRTQVYPSLKLIERCINAIQSMRFAFLSKLHFELAKCEEGRLNYSLAMEYLEKAKILNGKGPLKDNIDFAIKNIKMKISKEYGPVRAIEQAIYYLKEVLSEKPKEADKLRNIFLQIGDTLSSGLFYEILRLDQGSKEFESKTAWISIYGDATRKLDYYNQLDLDPENHRIKFILWTKLCRMASQEKIWDICRTAARFGISLSAFINPPIEKSTAAIIEEELGSESFHRKRAMLNLFYAQGLTELIESEDLFKAYNESIAPLAKVTFSTDVDKQTEDTTRQEIVAFFKLLHNNIYTHLAIASEIGVQLKEGWITAYAAAVFWNFCLPFMKESLTTAILNELATFHRHLMQLGAEGDPTHLLNYSVAILKKAVESAASTPTSPAKNNKNIRKSSFPRSSTKLRSLAHFQVAGEKLDMCDIVFNKLCQTRYPEKLPMSSFHYLLSLWLRMKVAQGVVIEEAISNMLQIPVPFRPKFQFLISLETLRLNSDLNEDLQENQLLELIDWNESIVWDDPNFNFKVWLIITDIAYRKPFFDCFDKCYAFFASWMQTNISDARKMDKITVDNAKLVCHIYMKKGELCLMNRYADVRAILQALRHFCLSARWLCTIKCEDLMLFCLRNYWNLCVPMLEDEVERVFLRQSLLDIFTVIMEFMSKSKKIATGKGMALTLSNEFKNLACKFTFALVQVLLDNDEYSLALETVYTIYPVISVKFESLLIKHLKFVYQTLQIKYDTSIFVNLEDYKRRFKASEWSKISKTAKNPFIQIQCLINAISLSQDSDDLMEPTLYLLELSEYCYVNQLAEELALQPAKLAHKICNHAITLSLGSEEENHSVRCRQLNYLLYTKTLLIKLHRNGSYERSLYTGQAGLAVLQIWQEIMYILEETYFPSVFESKFIEWLSSSFIPDFFQQEIVKEKTFSELGIDEPMKLCICLEFLGKNLYVMGLLNLFIPVLMLKRLIAVKKGLDDLLISIDIKIINVCIILNLNTSTIQHLCSSTFKSLTSISHEIEFFQNLDYLETMKNRILKLSKKLDDGNYIYLHDRYSESTLEISNNIKRRSAICGVSIKNFLERVPILTDLGYFGLVLSSLQTVWKHAEALENTKLLTKIMNLTAEVELIVGNVHEAQAILIKAQNLVSDDNDCFHTISLYVDAIAKDKERPNSQSEAERIIREAMKFFETLIHRFPLKEQKYAVMINQLEVRKMQLRIECLEKNTVSDIKNAVQFFSRKAKQFLEFGYIRYGIELLVTAVDIGHRSVDLDHIGFNAGICEQIIQLRKKVPLVTEALQAEDQFSSMIPLPPGCALPSFKAVLQLKVLYNAFLLDSAMNWIKVKKQSMESEATYDQEVLMINKFMQSQPPWDWILDSITDIIATEEAITIATTISRISPPHSRFHIQSSYLLGISQHVNAKYLRLKDNEKNDVYRQLLLQAKNYLVQSLNAALPVNYALASKAALALIECTIEYDPLTAFQFLILYQALEASIKVHTLLLRVFQTPAHDYLTALLHQIQYLEKKHLEHTSLYISYQQLLRDHLDTWSGIKSAEDIIFLKKELPFSINVIVILQHSSKRSQLFCGIWTSFGKLGEDVSNIEKIAGNAERVDKLIELHKSLQNQWNQLQQKQQRNEFVDETSLITSFRDFLLNDLEEYLNPICEMLQNKVISRAASNTSATSEIPKVRMLLLMDEWLQQLPVESLFFIKLNLDAETIVRDFSLNFFLWRAERISPYLKPPVPAASTTKGAVKTARNQSASANPVVSQNNKPPGYEAININSHDVLYAIEEEKYLRENYLAELLKFYHQKTKTWKGIIDEAKFLYSDDWPRKPQWQKFSSFLACTSTALMVHLCKKNILTEKEIECRAAIAFHFEPRKKSLYTSSKNIISNITCTELAMLFTIAGYQCILTNLLSNQDCNVINKLTSRIMADILHNKATIDTASSVLQEKSLLAAQSSTGSVHNISKKKSTSLVSVSGDFPTSEEEEALAAINKREKIENFLILTHFSNNIVCYGLPSLAMTL